MTTTMITMMLNRMFSVANVMYSQLSCGRKHEDGTCAVRVLVRFACQFFVVARKVLVRFS